MKKVILLMVSLLAVTTFSGCRATPSVASTVAQMYDTTKTVWVKGQEVVVINADLLDDKTLKKLNDVNEMALKVDATKEAIENVDATAAVITNATKLIDSETAERIKKTAEVINR